MKLGSMWSSTNSKKFKITDLKVIGDQKWIYYMNVNTNQNYSCLEEAFKSRFRELVNNG
jgi:hypothetical protein